MRKILRLSRWHWAAVVAAMPLASRAAPFYVEDFDADATPNWTFNSSIAADEANDNAGGEANFFFNYGDVGIPSAPHSVGGTTRGLKLEANIPGTGVFSGISVSPNSQSFTGDYQLRFDAWQNFNGPFPGGGSGSTQMTGGGIGTSGTVAQFPGGSVNSIIFTASGDGGSAQDYRAYTAPGAPVATSTGAYPAGTATSAVNSSDPYYAGFGGAAAPAAQLALFPQQTGNTATGVLGMGWHAWTITKQGDTVTWEVDGQLLATVDATTANLGGDNILLSQFDINATSSTDTNARSLLFGLIDNVVVDAVPEPGAITLAALGMGMLLGRRQRRGA